MKNSELLKQPNDRLISGLESQRRHILLNYAMRQPCPNCFKKQNVFEAAGIDVDDYDMNTGGDPPYRCIEAKCGRALKLIVPFVRLAAPHWEWALVPIELNQGEQS